MLKRDNAVIFHAAFADACALWRLFMPHVSMPGTRFVYSDQQPDWVNLAGLDVVVVQRLFTPDNFQFLRMCESLGLNTIYDLDDNVWEIPKYNPAFGTLNNYREGFKACIRMVDCVTVSTKPLADAVLRHVGRNQMVNIKTGRAIPVVVAENRIEERLFAKPVIHDKLIVGWAGSSSHIGDLSLIQDAVVNCSRESPDVVFEFRGCVLADADPIRTAPGYRHVLWTPVNEYASRMPVWGWSIALAPVQDLPFNASKSSIKMVEAGYCGIPCLASWVTPYEQFCHKDRELVYLLCRNSREFERKLRQLIHEPDLRADLGRRMRNVVTQHYSLNRPHEGWREAIELARGR